jgi:hypothetical protein
MVSKNKGMIKTDHNVNKMNPPIIISIIKIKCCLNPHIHCL